MTRSYDGPSLLAHADRRVVIGFHLACDERKVSMNVRVALFATGCVEANMQNPTGGDRDSVGSLQQRAGWGTLVQRMDPHHAALSFLADATGRVLPRHPNIGIGELAQAVQRSAFPAEYAAAVPAARYIISKTMEKTVTLCPVVYHGRRFDQLTVDAIKEAERILGFQLAFTQGACSTSVQASGGTHSGCGAGDVDISGYDEAKILRVVRVLRTVGLWAWYRRSPEWSGGRHIHFIRYGAHCLSGAAARQMVQAENGTNGLVSHARDRHADMHLKPVSWENYLAHKNGTKPDPAQPPVPKPVVHATISRGSTGPDVVVLQRLLGVRPTNGKFGPITQAAVKRYQKAKGLFVDGIVGPQTWHALTSK